MKKILILGLVLLVTGCAASRQLVDGTTTRDKMEKAMKPMLVTFKGSCKTHGRGDKAYKFGEKFYCTTCVLDNMERGMNVLDALAVMTEANNE